MDVDHGTGGAVLEARNQLSKWQDAKNREYQQIQRAAKRVSKKLRDRVRVSVTMSGNREPLKQLLRDELGGSLAAAIEKLESRAALSHSDLAE